ncbi:Pre protein translocase subunit Sec66-domain-containing protein [Cladochytrium replicatum]|nr:Pre protein translocase subunit Sec66-domain-containing protein [Cladochytrium replicatum]
MAQPTTTASWLLPSFYLLFLGALLYFFVRWNSARVKRENMKNEEDGGFFGPHVQKVQYEELANSYSPEDPEGKKLLIAALIRRALVDVHRIWQIRDDKPSMYQLVKQGVISEDLWERLLAAEQALEAEILEVAEDAELYRPGWGKTIFQDVSNLLQQVQQRETAAAKAAAEAAKERPSSPDKEYSADVIDGTEKPVDKIDQSVDELLDDETKHKIQEERAQRIAEELLKEEEEEKKKAGGRVKGSSQKKKNK